MFKYKGKLEGEAFGFIAVDNFSESVINQCSAFFLSHYHADHYIDLLKRENAVKVGEIFRKNCDKVLYCSEITKRIFLSNRNVTCFIPESQIISLPIGKTVVISNHSKLNDKDTVLINVTLIPSGHILGAVMFLFEYKCECVLFTGDFRIYPNDIPKMKFLQDSEGNVKHMTHLYLDTTFASSKFPYFPLRSKISLLVADIASKWLSSSVNHEIHLFLPYKFAFEKLMMDLSKALKCKIRINSGIYNSYYAFIPELDDVLLPDDVDYDKIKHRIHATTYHPKECYACISLDKNNIKAIRPCAMSFNKNVLKNRLVLSSRGYCEIIRVPYSTHCSLEELKAFVSYLNPKVIFSINDYKDESKFEEAKEHILSLISKSVSPSETLCSSMYEAELFNYSELSDVQSYADGNKYCDSDNDSIPLDSPPR